VPVVLKERTARTPRRNRERRAFFQDSGFNEQWGGRPLTDHEILAKYTGLRGPEVECFMVEEDRHPVDPDVLNPRGINF